MADLSRTPLRAWGEDLARRPVRALVGLGLGLAALNLAVLMAKIGGVVSVLYLNSDTASGPVIASLAGAAPNGAVFTLGKFPSYETMWFLQATVGLPFHRQIWEAAPVVWTLASDALLVWAAGRVFGRWALVVTATALLCLTPFQQKVFFTLDVHGPVLVHACVLVGLLVWLSTRRQPPRWPLLLLLSGPVAAFTGIGLASDQLGYVAYLLPFVAAACLAAWRRGGDAEGRLAVFAVGTSALAVVAGALIDHTMTAIHWVDQPIPLTFVSPGAIFPNLDIFANAFTNIGGGDFFGAPLKGTNYLTFVAGSLTLAALFLVVRRIARSARRALARTRSRRPGEAAADAYVVFWATALAGSCASFLLSSAPVDAQSGRYITIAYIAVAALLPGVARTVGSRGALAGGLVVFAALAVYGTAREPSAATPSVLPVAPPVAGQIERFVLAHGARYGYAGYWEAAALTWATRLGIQVYPAHQCGPSAATICPYGIFTISSWYVPRPNTPTFLIADPSQQNALASDPASGRPIATASFGSAVVEVYDHDIAATMSP